MFAARISRGRVLADRLVEVARRFGIGPDQPPNTCLTVNSNVQ